MSLQRHAATFIASINRPAFALSALLMIAYLVLEPCHLESIDRDYQQNMSFARDPDAYWKRVENAVQSIRANEQLMDEITGTLEWAQ
jgi:hypothetical protein